jgi:hypothetical protein
LFKALYRKKLKIIHKNGEGTPKIPRVLFVIPRGCNNNPSAGNVGFFTSHICSPRKEV